MIPSMIHRCQITHRVPNCLGARAGKRGAYFYAPYIAQDHRHDHGGRGGRGQMACERPARQRLSQHSSSVWSLNGNWGSGE